MTNAEWVELLAKEFKVSNTVAKVMLHQLHKIKKTDNFKKSLEAEHRLQERA